MSNTRFDRINKCLKLFNEEKNHALAYRNTGVHDRNGIHAFSGKLAATMQISSFMSFHG